MSSRRTDARFRWLMSAVQLLLFVGLRHKSKQYADLDREDLTSEDNPATAFWAGASESALTARLSPTDFGTGFVKSVLYEVIYDDDLWGVQQSRRTQLVVNGTYVAVRRRLVGRSPESAFSHGVGESLGRLLYRTRYGLLGEPRGDEATENQ